MSNPPSALITVGPNFGSVTVNCTNNGIGGNNGVVKACTISLIQADNSLVRNLNFLENIGMQSTGARLTSVRWNVLSAKYGNIDNSYDIDVTDKLQYLYSNATTDSTQPVYLTYDTTHTYEMIIINTNVFSSTFGNFSYGTAKRLSWTIQILSENDIETNIYPNLIASVGPTRGGISYIGTGKVLSALTIINEPIFGALLLGNTKQYRTYLEACGDGISTTVPAGYEVTVVSATYESIDGRVVKDVTSILQNAFDKGPNGSTLMTPYTVNNNDIIYIIHTDNFNAAFTDIDVGTVKILRICYNAIKPNSGHGLL